MNIILIALLSIVLSVIAQFFLKMGIASVGLKNGISDMYSLHGVYSVFTNIYILTGFSLYGLGAVVWLGVLSQWDVSKAYPFVGLGFMLTVLVGFVLGEQVTLNRVIGVFLISIGVWMVANT